MNYTSTQKYVRITPQKAREVVSMIKKMTPSQAVEALPFSRKTAAQVVAKTIKSAIENAKQKGADEKELLFAEIQVNEGPRLKRGILVSKGRWHPILKRMCHIRIVLKTKEMPKVIVEDLKGKTKNTKKGNKSETKAAKSTTKSKVVKGVKKTKK